MISLPDKTIPYAYAFVISDNANRIFSTDLRNVTIIGVRFVTSHSRTDDPPFSLNIEGRHEIVANFLREITLRLQRATSNFIHHCLTAVSLSLHTHRAYKADLSNFLLHAGPGRSIASISKEDLRSYIKALRDQHFQESSIKRKLSTVKLLFRWLISEELLASNPFDTLNERIRLPRRLPRALDSGDFNKLHKAITPKDNRGYDETLKYSTVQLLLETGVRVSELCSISLDDLSIANRSVRVHGKGNRQRLVYFLSPTMYRKLCRYLTLRETVATTCSRLFLTEKGLPLTPAHVRKHLHNIAVTAGIERKVTPHMLRHTCATQWLESGLDIRHVQKLLGHHSISTTEIYTHVSDRSLKGALLKAMQAN